MSYYPEPDTLIKSIIKVELDLSTKSSSFATKPDIKKATCVDTSEFVKKSDLISLKSDVDILHIDELKTVPVCVNNLKTDEDKLVITESQTILADQKTFCDAVDKIYLKNSIY